MRTDPNEPAARLVREMPSSLARGDGEVIARGFDLTHAMIRELDGRIRFWSSGMERLYGWTRDEATGRVSHELLRTEFPKPLDEIEAELLRTGHWEGELKHHSRDGRPVTVASHWALDRDGAARLLRVIEVNNDVTALKASEEELGRSNAMLGEARRQLERTLDTAGMGLTRCSRDLRYLSVNPAYAKWVGVPLEQIVGRPMVEVMGAEAFEVVRPHVERVLRGDRVEFEAELLPQAAGRPTWLKVIYTPDIADTGAVVGWVGSVTDITDRKRAEEELRTAKAAAEEASAEKTRFLAAASHDLRQPLSALTLAISLLATRVKDDEKSARLAAQAGHATQSLTDLLNALLDVAQLDAGNVVPRVAAFPVADVLGAMRDEFEQVALVNRTRFKVEDCDETVRSDPALLGRIVRNLISNALKYTPAGGEVTVTCAKSDDGRLSIAVTDTGIGIPKIQQAVIFEDFRQLSNPERDRAKGVGLGLSIVARMAQILGHSVWLKSEPGRGSVFTVTVPLGHAVQAQGAAEAPQVRGAGRVLLTEDEELVADLLREVLEDAGFEVLLASTAEEALRLIEGIHAGAPPLDAVIADYRLPGLTGLNVVHTARRRFPLTVAVVITGDVFDQQLRGIEAEGIRLLQKPVLPSVLADVMRDIAAQREATSSTKR